MTLRVRFRNARLPLKAREYVKPGLSSRDSNVTHPWRQQDPDAAAAWLASFAGPRRAEPATTPSRRTLTSLGLAPFNVELPQTLRIIPIDDVSDSPDDL
jgi:hypothetical protein